VLENKYDHVSAIYHLLVDRCKKHQAAIAAGQSAPPLQPMATNSSVSPTHLPVTTKLGLQRRRSSITTGVGQCATIFCCLLSDNSSACSCVCSPLVKSCLVQLVELGQFMFSFRLWKFLLQNREPSKQIECILKNKGKLEPKWLLSLNDRREH